MNYRPRMSLFVDIATMSDSDNEYHELLVLDLVYDSVVPHAAAPQIQLTAEFQTSRWTGIRGKPQDCRIHAFLDVI